MASTGKTPLLKAPCLFPLPDGRRCCECATCQPTPEEIGTDKTPLERRVESRVKAAELHETLAARWYGEDVPELQAEVVRLRQERDDLQAKWEKDNLCGICPYRRAIQGEVERLREALRLSNQVRVEHHAVHEMRVGEECPICSNPRVDEMLDKIAELTSPDKPPERVVRTTITDLDAFN